MESKKYFEQVAGEWDSMRASFFPTAIREKAFSLLPIPHHAVVADLGCGTGYITEGLADQVVKIIAVDQSEKMLAVMKKKFQTYDNISYRVGGANDLPIATATVDVAFANMYLHHVEDPQSAIMEAFRILKKGGSLVITDLDTHQHTFLRTEQYDIWMGFDRKEVEEWFAIAGFKDIAMHCAGESCKSKAASVEDEADVSVFIAFGRK